MRRGEVGIRRLRLARLRRVLIAAFAAFACEETHLPKAFDFDAFVPYVVANDAPIDVFAAAHIAFAV